MTLIDSYVWQTLPDEACVAGMPLTEARLNGMKKVTVFYELLLLEHYMGLVRIKKECWVASCSNC